MGHLNVVDIFLGAIASVAHIANYITCRHNTAFFQSFRIRIVLPKMRIVVIALLIKTSDTDTPAAVTVPADGFYIAGFDCYDGCADLNIKLNMFRTILGGFKKIKI